MPVKVEIKGQGSKTAQVHDSGHHQGLVVFSDEHHPVTDLIAYLTNPLYGSDMTQNALFSGTTVGIHDGIDHIWWTGSAIAGAWTFNSVAQNHTDGGSNSIDGTATTNGSVAQIAKGSDEDLSAHAGISGWIYLSSFTDTGIKILSVYGYDTGTAAPVGTSVNIYDYIDTTLIGVWQSFNIPLDSMSLVGETIDAFRFQVTNALPGQPPDFYIDDFYLEEAGGPITFEYVVPAGNTAYLDKARIVIADNYDSDHADASVPFIEYNDLLGKVGGVSNGIIFKVIKDETAIVNSTFNTLGGFLEWPSGKITNVMSSGATTFVTIESDSMNFTVLEGNLGDSIQMVIQDDMSVFQVFKATLGIKIRESHTEH